MAEKVKVIKSEVIARFEEGNSKEEVRKKYYPSIPAAAWKDIWKKCKLEGKRVPSVIVDFVDDDFLEDLPEDIDQDTPFDEDLDPSESVFNPHSDLA